MTNGHSLLELVVSIAVAAVALSALYLVRFQSPDQATSPTYGLVGVDVQPALHRLMRAVQEGTRLFYPRPGKGIHEGLGFVDARGDTMLVYVQRTPDSGRAALYWVNTREHRHAPDAVKPYILDVSHFHVTVAPAADGKAASLVHVDLAVEVPGRGSDRTRRLNFVDAAFLRNLERTVPDDLFPAGTPLGPVDGP